MDSSEVAVFLAIVFKAVEAGERIRSREYGFLWAWSDAERADCAILFLTPSKRTCCCHLWNIRIILWPVIHISGF